MNKFASQTGTHATERTERTERIFAEFKSATVDPAEFDHEAHVLVAWHYLQDDDLLPAIQKYSEALKALTVKLGVAGKNH